VNKDIQETGCVHSKGSWTWTPLRAGLYSIRINFPMMSTTGRASKPARSACKAEGKFWVRVRQGLRPMPGQRPEGGSSANRRISKRIDFRSRSSKEENIHGVSWGRLERLERLGERGRAVASLSQRLTCSCPTGQ